MSTKDGINRKAARKHALISSTNNLKNIAVLSTCSMTFIEKMTSNCFGFFTSISANI